MRKISLLLPFLMTMFYSNIAHSQCSNVNFTASVTKGCSPLGVVFSATGIPAGAKIEWNLGGGFITGTDTAYRAFVTSGKKSISLRITESGKTSACTTVNKADIVEVLPKPDIKIHFSDTLLCNGSANVTITDSTANVASRSWIFDGVKGNGNAQITQLCTLGRHSVTLEVTNNFGCKEIYKNTNAINVYNPEQLEFCGNLSVDGKKITASMRPSYFGTIPKKGPDKKLPIAYDWSFPGAKTTSSTSQNATAVYNNLTQAQLISLTVTYSGGCKYTKSVNEYVTKYMGLSDTLVCIGEQIEITNLAPGSGRQGLTWSFPGGKFLSGSTNSKFKISYQNSGEKDIQYIFKYSGHEQACETRVTHNDALTVEGPEAKFRAPIRAGCKADTFKLFSTSALPNNNGTNVYTWLIYDSDSTSPQFPMIVGPSASSDTIDFPFPKDDVYDVTLIVSNSQNGCSD
ncbi:MAG: hypothetical protein KDC92_02385, partial [Bacteroidetes bacterium]|nr:hypothetical protein [Bacteroidota bacterium]